MKDLGISVVVILVILVLFGVAAGCERLSDCKILGEQSGWPTKYERGACLVEIAPGLWVADDQLIYYLDFVKEH